MAANNVNVMVKEAVRALKANNKAEARALLEKATELDPYNEQAWLWLSGVVETEEDQRTCLQNVVFINPGNQNAIQGIAMLDAKSAAKPKTEPRPTNMQAFADFDLPAGDNWLAELDEMRHSTTSMPTTNPFNVSLDDFDMSGGDEFSDPFSDPFGAGGGPFSANVPTIPDPPAVTMPIVAKETDLEDELDSLFGGAEAVQAAPASPSVKQNMREKARPEKKRDPLDNIADDADAATLFGIIPDTIKRGTLPGMVTKAPVTMRLLFALLILGNIILITLIFTKVTA